MEDISKVKLPNGETYNIKDTISREILWEIAKDVGSLLIQTNLMDMQDIPGIEVDFSKNTCTRVGAAVDLEAGKDFDKFECFGGRKRCNLSDIGTVNAYYGDEDFKEDGSNGQVMVEQPKFYYKVIPLVVEDIEDKSGKQLVKAQYYVSSKPQKGFKLHPAFIDEDGNVVDKIYIGAYEGCIYSESSQDYLKNDEQTANFTTDKLSSIANVQPCSGLSQQLTITNAEKIAVNRGKHWHITTAKIASLEQFLMMIEYGTMDIQSKLGNGVVSITDVTTKNCSSYTGSTSSLGNSSGAATKTLNKSTGSDVEHTENGKVSVSYRGVENPYGNIWECVIGINVYGNGSNRGGTVYLAKDFNHTEGKHDDNFESVGFNCANANGYIKNIGYNEKFDWGFFATNTQSGSGTVVNDYYYCTPNLNDSRVAFLGGSWNYGACAGCFYWALNDATGVRSRNIGARLNYI